MQKLAQFGITAALALTASGVLAQSTKERVGMLEGQVMRIERLLENNQSLQTDLLQRLNGLQTENQGLREAVDQLQFESNKGSERQRQLYLDLDSRLQVLEGGGKPAAQAAAGAGAGATTPEASYQAAFELLKQGEYGGAKEGFTSFLASYPDSDLRGNGQYWLAETYYVTKDFPRALAEFQKVIADYPTSRKIPDAWLKLGYCNYELKRWTDARVALSTVKARYAESTAARLAQQRLEQMQGQGR